MRHLLFALLLSSTLLQAAPRVEFERGRVEGASWRFPSIVAPRQGDLAEKAQLRLVSGKLEKIGAPLAALADGVISNSGDDPSQATFLSNDNASGGRVTMDLGAVQPIAQINTYSSHDYPPDGGARGPQVYALYGSSAAAPDAADLSAWTRIAEVDTRPNQTGDDWGGIHGVQITDPSGLLGSYRHLLWDLRPTGSPRASSPSRGNTFYVEFDVYAPGFLEDAQPAHMAAGPGGVKRVVLVYKTHFDIGYTALAREVLHNYRTTMIDKALAVVDRNAELPAGQQFVWTVPGWPMKAIAEAWPGHDPRRRQRIEDAIRDGRFVTHALPFTLHTDLMEPEEVVRGFVHASEINRAIGKALPRSAKMTDVPCHPWLLPTVLKHADVEFLHLGCNGHSSPVEVPDLFWWEGPDGSRVLTYYSPMGYGTGLLPPANWPHATWLALIHTGDNHGPPTPEAVREDIDRIRKTMPQATITVGEMEDFSDALLAEDPKLPTLRVDMPDTWIHGMLAAPVGAKIARNTRPRLAAAEMLGTLLAAHGVPPASSAKTVAAAYEQSLLYAEHTWGLAHPYLRHPMHDGEAFLKAKADRLYARDEESWAEQRAYIDSAARLTDDLLDRHLNALAAGVQVSARRAVVFNPLPWTRSGRVNINGRSRFVENVPAGGWITLDLESGPARETPKPPAPDARVLENSYFRITLAEGTAGIASLVDKRTGREWVRQDAETSFGSILYQRFSRADTERYRNAYTRNGNTGFWKNWLPADVPRLEAAPRNAVWTITSAEGQTVAEAASPGGDGMPFPTRLRVTLDDHEPFIEIEAFLENKPETAWPEALWICLPTAVDSPAFRLGRPGGIADPVADFVRASNRHLIALHTGMTVTAPDGTGVGLCSPDTPLVSLDRPGAWEFSRDFVPRRSDVFVHLFNNMWSTNFRMWKGGSWSARVRLWVVASQDDAAALVAPSLETRYPLLAATANTPAGSLPARAAGVSVSRPGTLVTAFGANPDGAGTLLRVWEMAGVSGDLTVTLPGNFTTATPVNLRGENTGEPIAIGNGKFTINLPAYAPASLLLQ